MTTNDTTNPRLAVHTVPEEKERYDRVGRLYREPDFVLPENFTNPETLLQLITDGKLVPSITNAIGVLSKPYLYDWYAKQAAESAMYYFMKTPESVKARPGSAFNYFKNAPYNYMKKWGQQGSNIHSAAEKISTGQPYDHKSLTAYEQACVDHYKRWLEDFQPTFNYVERTGFGTTINGKGYAGTADYNIKIQGEDILGDIKCTTLDTRILMADGSYKQAGDIRVGDKVVSWNADGGTLSVDEVSHVADNGSHEIFTVHTETGHAVSTTGNHPYLTLTDKSQLVWKNADALEQGDTVFTVSGWNHSPNKPEAGDTWQYNKHLAPYLLGLLWGLRHSDSEQWEEDNKTYKVPTQSRDSLFEELAYHGFVQVKGSSALKIKRGLQRTAHKARNMTVSATTPITVEELLSVINNPELPEYLFTTGPLYFEGFYAGIKEVFRNPDLDKDTMYVEMASVKAIRSLQLFLQNNGQATKIVKNTRTGQPALAVQTFSPVGTDTVIYGTQSTKVTAVKKSAPQPTVAIEVKNNHNHVTNGILTHNTNRTGFHDDLALQLVANRHVDYTYDDNNVKHDNVPVQRMSGLHLSPQGYNFVEVIEKPFLKEVFSQLVDLWHYQVQLNMRNATKEAWFVPFQQKEAF